MARLIRAAIVAALVVVVDQVTKWMALNALEPGPCSEPDACIDLVLGIKFNLVFNTGAAFTSGSGYGPVFGVLAFFMTGFLLYLASQRQDRWGLLGFAAIAGGAAGNLLDRIFRADDGFLSGAVIDFIDFGWWPVFNIADSAIVLGVIGILIMTAFEKPAESPGSDDLVPDDAVPDDAVPDDAVPDDAVPDDPLSDDADSSTSDGERAPGTDTGEDPSGDAAIVESGD